MSAFVGTPALTPHWELDSPPASNQQKQTIFKAFVSEDFKGKQNVYLKATLQRAQSLTRNVFPSVSLWPSFPPGISSLAHVLSVLPVKCLFFRNFTSPLDQVPQTHLLTSALTGGSSSPSLHLFLPIHMFSKQKYLHFPKSHSCVNVV